MKNHHRNLGMLSTIVFCLFFGSNLFAQFPNQHLDNFWEICRLNDHYYDSIATINGPDTLEETGRELFERWKYEWQPIIPPNGSIKDAIKKKIEVQNNAGAFEESHTNSMYSSDWQELGPFYTPTGPDNISDVGRLATVAIDPADPNSIFVGSSVGGLFYSNDGGAKFQNGGTDILPYSNGVSSIVITTVEAVKYWFIATGDRDNEFSYSNGIYRSTNSGKNWVRISAGFPDLANSDTYYRINRLLAHPTNPNIMIAAVVDHSGDNSVGGIYVTHNALDEVPVWERKLTGQYFDLAFRPDPDNIYDYERLYASAKTNDFAHYSTDQFPLLFYTDDLGEGWDPITIDITSIQPNVLATDNCEIRISVETTRNKPENLYIYLAYINVSNNGNTTTTVAGGNFGKCGSNHNVEVLSITDKGEPGRVGFAISPTNASLMYFGCQALYYSIDGGQTWEIVSPNCHADIHGIKFSDDGNTIWVASDGGLSKKPFDPSSDAWVDMTNNIGCCVVDVMAISKSNPNDYITGGWDCGSNLLQNNPTPHWTHVNGGDCWTAAYDPILNGTYYVSTGSSIKYYNNYQLVSTITPSNVAYKRRAIITGPRSSDTLICTSPDTLYRSDNRGLSWHPIKTYSEPDPNFIRYPYDGWWSPSSHCFYLRVIVDDPIYSDQYDQVLRTNNILSNPVVWDDPTIFSIPFVNENDRKSVAGIAVDELNPNKIWVAYYGHSLNSSDCWKVAKGVFSGNAWTWTDVSHSLQSLNPNITSIVHVNGPNDGLFVGTEVGVFYIDNTLSDWVSYSNGLPKKEIKQLQVRYESGVPKKLVAGAWGRGLWETSLECMQNSQEYPVTVADEKWETDKTVNQIVRIYPGAKLTISAHVNFTTEAKIIVEKGGKLVINGGVLSSACPGMWQGIEVWGDKNISQYYSDQTGWVSITNNGTIQNAKCGIRVAQMIDRMPVAGTGGGIVSCNKAIFKNNKVAVDFYPYANIKPFTTKEVGNLSYFTNCDFISDNNYLAINDKPQVFVSLQKVKGIYFRGCTFKNLMTLASIAETERGMGIYAFGSGFSLDRVCTSTYLPCSTYKKSTFEGLYYGIKALGDGNPYYIGIANSEFTRNLRGVYIGGIDLVNINKNIFITRPSGTIVFPSSGIYLDRCSGYSVSENDLSGTYSEASNSYEIGIVVNNSGEASNMIYNNKPIRNLRYGILAQNKNRSIDGNSGLTIKCNDFLVQNLYDIAVTKSDGNAVQMGINKYQGVDGANTTDPAGNTFSYSWIGHPLFYNESDYKNECENLSYIYHSSALGASIEPKKYSAAPKVSPAPNSHGVAYSKNLACPSNIGSGGNSTVLRNNKLIAEGKIDSTTFQLNLLKDGGNTEDLITEVQTSTAPDALTLRNELLDKSPYLSDTVMIEVVNKEDVLPAAMVTEVLVANPQSAKAEEIAQALDSRDNPLSEDQRDDIDQGIFILGAKESLESELAQYKTERANAQFELLRYFLADTTGIVIDSVNEALIAEPDLWAKYLLCMQQSSIGDTLGAGATFQSIENSNNLSAEEQMQLEAYINYTNVLEQLVNAESIIPDSLQEISLKAIASDTLYQPSAYARAVLLNAGKIEYNEPYVFPTDGLKSGKVIVKKQKSYPDEYALKIYPNPAKDYIIAEYTLKEGVLNAVLKIDDVTGKTFKTIAINSKHDYLVILMNDYVSGILFCKLIVNNKVVESAKISILK